MDSRERTPCVWLLKKRVNCSTHAFLVFSQSFLFFTIEYNCVYFDVFPSLPVTLWVEGNRGKVHTDKVSVTPSGTQYVQNTQNTRSVFRETDNKRRDDERGVHSCLLPVHLDSSSMKRKEALTFLSLTNRENMKESLESRKKRFAVSCLPLSWHFCLPVNPKNDREVPVSLSLSIKLVFREVAVLFFVLSILNFADLNVFSCSHHHHEVLKRTLSWFTCENQLSTSFLQKHQMILLSFVENDFE